MPPARELRRGSTTVAKQTIGGKEIDLLSREELAAELRSAVEFFVSGYMRPPQWSRPEGGVALTAGGAGIADIYVPPAGMIFRLTRLFVTASAATFGVPVSVSSGGIDVYRGVGSANDPVDGTPITSLPQIATWSRSNGPVFTEGEWLRVGVTGGPASGQLYVRAGGFLEPKPLTGED